MATTAQQVIDRSLRLLHQIPAGASPTADETANGLTALNAMIGSWIANRDIGVVTLVAFASASTSQSLPDGYDQALAFNLAVALAPEYEATPRPEIIEEAKRSLAFIRRAAAPAIAGTAQKIINKALRIIGHLGPDEISTATESAYGLDSLNALIESWRNERLIVYARIEESLAFTAAVSRTIGPTGNLVTTRPVRIDRAWVVDSGNVSHDVQMISDEEYGAIALKTATSTWPSRANYKASMPDGTIYFYPVPNAAGTMKLLTWIPLGTFAAVSTAISLPSGYERALVYNLAIDIAPEYGKSPPPDVLQIAREAKANVKRANKTPLKAYTELPALVGRSRGNILTGI